MADNKGYIKNMELLAFHDLEGKPGFQMAMQVVNGRWYLYMVCRSAPGWHILDVTDPAKPKYVNFVKGPEKGARTVKVQVADGIMVGTLTGNPNGVYIFDVKTDPENPKFLSHWDTGVPNGDVHRFFYNGGRYVHMSSTCKGFVAQIYRIIDIIDPTHPVEVGRFWRQEQWLPGYTAAERQKYLNSHPDAQIPGVWAGLHGSPYVKGNLAYCSWGVNGMMILDISDITLPQLVGQLKHHPPFAGELCGAWTHTVMPLSKLPYAVMTSEGERFVLFTDEILKNRGVPPMSLFGIVDVSDPTNPTLISMFPYPEVPPGFPYQNFNYCGLSTPGPFGPHNVHEPHDNPDLEDRNDRIYCCYFHAGFRVYDISDPFVPKEIAYFIPPNPTKWLYGVVMDQNDPTFNMRARPRGPMLATAEDVLVDKRGNIFMTTYHDGLYVLRCTV